MSRHLLPWLSLLALSACSEGPSRGADRGTRVFPVEVEKIRRGTLPLTLSYVGELAAPEAVELAANVGGRLRAVRVQLGDRVERGALLAQIDDAEIRAQHQEATAALEVARASQVRARVESDNAEQELVRKEPLAQQDLITRQELDNVRTRRDSVAATLQVASAQVSQAEARLQLLGQQLSDARVVAPFSGWVEARHLDAGAVVSPGAPILGLVRTDPIVVRFKVSEREVGEIRRRMAQGGLDVSLHLDAYPKEKFAGTVRRLAPSIDASSRSAPVEAELDNAEGRMMPGMYGRVILDLGSKPDALRVPLLALLTGSSETASTRLRGEARKSALYLVEEKVARRVEIELGHEHGGYGEVLSGIEEGMLVVVRGQSSLSDGASVEVVAEGEPQVAEPTERSVEHAP